MVKGVLTLTLLPSKNSPYHNTDFDDTNETHPFRYPNGMSARMYGIDNMIEILDVKNAHLLRYFSYITCKTSIVRPILHVYGQLPSGIVIYVRECPYQNVS